MLRVGPGGLRQRPRAPTPDWWALLAAVLRGGRGREWEWTERATQGRASVLHVRQVVFAVVRRGTPVTVRMRAVFDDGDRRTDLEAEPF